MHKFCTLSDAIALAEFCHRNQIDKAGMPYIDHPKRVLAGVQAHGAEPHVQIADTHTDIKGTDHAFTIRRKMLDEAKGELIVFFDSDNYYCPTYLEKMVKALDNAGEAKQAPLFRWIQEHNPSFSVELYKDLSDAVEANRAEFARVQNRLVDIKREHDNLRLQFPSSLFVGKRAELVINIVTSGKTKETFRTGEENDVDLFKK